MATPTDIPAPLRIPAILQNPTSASARLIEAHNAQQREKLAARKEAKYRASGSVGKGIGKRVIRRTDNAAFLDNPHIVAPRRTDLYPSVPLHPRPPRASFPPQSLDRISSIPSAPPRDADPFSESSVNGAFTTSLKGTRALLRKRGQRAEGVVTRVEEAVRSWLGDQNDIATGGTREEGWKVVDEHMVDVEFGEESEDVQRGISTSTSPFPTQLAVPPIGRRLPIQHRPNGILPALPTQEVGKGIYQVPAVLELSRSVAHLTLAAADPFDRLVIHLLARYYECLSWSEEHISSPTRPVRLTHLIIPSITRPRAGAAHNLLTPETTDISDLSSLSASDQSGSDRGMSSSHASEAGDTETETERGTEVDPDETFRQLDLEDSASVGSGLLHHNNSSLDLHRVNSAGSSAYASSEAESESSSMSIGGMGDSMTLFPPLPRVGEGRPLWIEGDDDVSSGVGFGARPMRSGISRQEGGGGGARENFGWADKPTFFEYLYGA